MFHQRNYRKEFHSECHILRKLQTMECSTYHKPFDMFKHYVVHVISYIFWLVVWNMFMHVLFVHSVGNFIIPTDFQIFRGGGIPQTSISCYIHPRIEIDYMLILSYFQWRFKCYILLEHLHVISIMLYLLKISMSTIES